MAAIFVNQDLCTRCGICSVVCPMSIVDTADENNLPKVQEARAGFCIRCGHCEVSCPSQALLLNFLPDEKCALPAGTGTVSPDDLGIYIKKRRSVRHFTKEPVSKEKIEKILDIARFAPSGGNGQPVQWLIVHNPAEVHRLAGLTIDWMKTLKNSSHPMSDYVPSLLAAWESGHDPVCRGAPHLVITHIPEGNPVASVDGLIALSTFDIAAPAWGVGTCWAGFLSMAAAVYEPLKEALALPAGRKYAYSLMFGYPQYKTYGIPRRNPVQVTWR
ncbi:nitroreductase family protein [Methanoregula sp.]|jgi:nitroreductase/NAD-dependent dihydropyrimidine dehydrogenase PreA subunit|uniref:nitroreductase family protein n=1 Tax=Methanoregula sp. TaxID=2052170 RepID=UPI003C1F2D42